MKAARLFNLTAGAILVAMATVLILSNIAVTGTTPGREPVLGLRMDTSCWLVAALCGLTGAYCLLGDREQLQFGLVAWLSVNFAVYACSLVWMREINLATLLQSGGVTNAFGFTAATWVAIAYIGFGFLLVGSLIGLCTGKHEVSTTEEISQA